MNEASDIRNHQLVTLEIIIGCWIILALYCDGVDGYILTYIYVSHNSNLLQNQDYYSDNLTINIKITVQQKWNLTTCNLLIKKCE